MVESVDVVLVTAIAEEFSAAKAVFSAGLANEDGVLEWFNKVVPASAPHITGTFLVGGEPRFSIALAVPSRMGAIRTSQLASVLVERLQPKSLVMCGVCAGNPADLALGDVVISELAYQYDEGKLETDGFVGDHRQSPISAAWLTAARAVSPDMLPSYGRPTSADARFWLLERLHHGDNPAKHPARRRYFSPGEWRTVVEALEADGLVTLDGAQFRLTEKGKAEVVRSLALDVDPPLKLPINVLVGPIASGNVVVKDGLTWDKLKRLGVRSVLGLEMEAAAIGEIARASNVHEWIVVKGVMDHADPHKDDRFKPFAARASAEVLRSFLIDRLCALGTSSVPSGETVGTLRPPATRNWQPRSPHAPFLDELADAMVLHAPRFRGLYDLARAKAIEAYGVADQAYAVAEKVRLSLGSTIKSTHAGQLNRKPKILRVPTNERERELIAKIWNSHDEYIGEATGDEADGLGISRVYAVTKDTTPELQASYAGLNEQGNYGPLGVYTFPNRAQFAGEWVAGHPSFGYREYLGQGNELGCDFYLGSMKADPVHPFRPVWHPHGEGITVDALTRLARCGEFVDGAIRTVLHEFSF